MTNKGKPGRHSFLMLYNSFIYAPVSKSEASKKYFNGTSFSDILYEGYRVSTFTLAPLMQF
jgi:hypothetical protein